ncbi:MAG: hypothetical protein GEV10_08485, partial [Streptosporangiales bacterium]|nr:hypothetical protein [Streptosporangiales bacterium]
MDPFGRQPYAVPSPQPGAVDAPAAAPPVFLVLIGNEWLAGTVARGLSARLAATGRAARVLVPPVRGRDFLDPACRARMHAWWEEQRTGVDVASAVLVATDEDRLGGLTHRAYVAVRPDRREAPAHTYGAAVCTVPAATIRDLVDAAAADVLAIGSATPDADVPARTPAAWDTGCVVASRPVTRRRTARLPDPPRRGRVRRKRRPLMSTAVLVGALGFGGWLLSAVAQPGTAQADTPGVQSARDHRPSSADDLRRERLERRIERYVRERTDAELRRAGVDSPRRHREGRGGSHPPGEREAADPGGHDGDESRRQIERVRERFERARERNVGQAHERRADAVRERVERARERAGDEGDEARERPAERAQERRQAEIRKQIARARKQIEDARERGADEARERRGEARTERRDGREAKTRRQSEDVRERSREARECDPDDARDERPNVRKRWEKARQAEVRRQLEQVRERLEQARKHRHHDQPGHDQQDGDRPRHDGLPGEPGDADGPGHDADGPGYDADGDGKPDQIPPVPLPEPQDPGPSQPPAPPSDNPDAPQPPGAQELPDAPQPPGSPDAPQPPGSPDVPQPPAPPSDAPQPPELPDAPQPPGSPDAPQPPGSPDVPQPPAPPSDAPQPPGSPDAPQPPGDQPPQGPDAPQPPQGPDAPQPPGDQPPQGPDAPQPPQ